VLEGDTTSRKNFVPKWSQTCPKKRVLGHVWDQFGTHWDLYGNHLGQNFLGLTNFLACLGVFRDQFGTRLGLG
jgi:hypothetical protein